MIRDQLQFGAVSVLFNEPKLLKCKTKCRTSNQARVSVLFNEPKLLKCDVDARTVLVCDEVSVLFNEPKLLKFPGLWREAATIHGFSALQRAEIAEIAASSRLRKRKITPVSVLFNEPKLLKFAIRPHARRRRFGRFQCSSTSRNC